MIIYRRRSIRTERAAGELPATKTLWRNTLIAWFVCGWGILALSTISPQQRSPGNSIVYFFSRHFGSDSLVAELSLAFSEVLPLLFYAALIACAAGGAFVGFFLLISSMVTTMHRSWRLDSGEGLTDSSETTML